MDGLHKVTKSRIAYYEKEIADQGDMERIVGEALSRAPRSLADCWSMGSLVGNTSRIWVALSPTVNLRNPRQNRIAVGTIDKVVTVLGAHGWDVGPRPAVSESGGSLNVKVAARKRHIVRYGRRQSWRRLWRRKEREVTTALEINFFGLRETDNCKLVEKVVTVEEVPEHTETKLVVECDDAEAPSG